jgi:hypothetical protein
MQLLGTNIVYVYVLYTECTFQIDIHVETLSSSFFAVTLCFVQ